MRSTLYSKLKTGQVSGTSFVFSSVETVLSLHGTQTQVSTEVISQSSPTVLKHARGPTRHETAADKAEAACCRLHPSMSSRRSRPRERCKMLGLPRSVWSKPMLRSGDGCCLTASCPADIIAQRDKAFKPLTGRSAHGCQLKGGL